MDCSILCRRTAMAIFISFGTAGCMDATRNGGKPDKQGSVADSENNRGTDSADKLKADTAETVENPTTQNRISQGNISVGEILTLDCIDEGEHRFGARDRIFLIEDQWDYDRYALLLPSLPKIDINSQSILVVMSWKPRPRSFQFARIDGKHLVIGVQQAPRPQAYAGRYLPPKFLVLPLPRWPGPVRFEINGKEEFTLRRGESLNSHARSLWDEILRIHSGGRPVLGQLMRYYRKRSPGSLSDDEIKDRVRKKRKQRQPIDLHPLYQMLFRDLIDLRARPIVPRVFELIDTMEQHDNAFGPAWNTLVAIGGPDVVNGCRKAQKSTNRRSRHAAMLILKDLALPECRDDAYAHLTGPDIVVARNALKLLTRIGLGKNDVPKLMVAIQELEEMMFDPDLPDARKNLGGCDSNDIAALIHAIGSIGPSATEAIPLLEKMATQPKFPLSSTLQKAAHDALKHIQPHSLE